MKHQHEISNEDIGAVMIAWYEEAIREIPGGLVTQAQAAKMLNLSRMAVSRLITRGHLRAVHFPQQTNVEGLKVSNDDPFWLKLMAALDPVFGDDSAARITWPEACYVSFADIKKLYSDAKLADKCRINWHKVFHGPQAAKDGQISTAAPKSRKAGAPS